MNLTTWNVNIKVLVEIEKKTLFQLSIFWTTKCLREQSKVSIDEICSTRPKKNYITNKIDVYYNDDSWSSDILDLNDYGPENNRRYRYVPIFIDNFSKFGWPVPLKKRNAETKTNCFEEILTISKKTKFNLNRLRRRICKQ